MYHSPNHVSSIPLVLNTQSSNVSPQFHCIYDDEFATCKRDAKFTSLWQFKAKFQSKPVATERTGELPTLAPRQYDKHNINVPILPPTAAPVERFVEPWDHFAEAPDETFFPPADAQQPNEPLIAKWRRSNHQLPQGPAVKLCLTID
jgi:hypothetical protein